MGDRWDLETTAASEVRSVNRQSRVCPAKAEPDRAPVGTRLLSAATTRAYQEDWNRFVLWCTQAGEVELPADANTICRFLDAARSEGRGLATLNRQMAAIAYMHREAGFLAPLLLPDSQKIRRAMARLTEGGASRPQRPTMRIWAEIFSAIGTTGREEIRDRALLALHVAGAFRCAELARLSPRQLHLERGSMQIHLGRFRSNTARGTSVITIVDDSFFLPVTHMRCWLDESGPQGSTVFRHCAGGEVTDRAMGKEDVRAVILDRGCATGRRLIFAE